MTTDDIVERIRKLLRLAENAGATEAEAAAALERANVLLIRHNLTADRIAVSTAADKQPVTEHQIRAGWAGSWRGSLLGILARHSLCSALISRQGKVDTVVVVGRPMNVEATHALYDWIAAQLERFALDEWHAFNRAQREAIANSKGVPWCLECEDWPETYRERGQVRCTTCDQRVLPERPLIHGFSWKTAFYRGALLRIKNRLYEQRQAQQADPTTAAEQGVATGAVTALVLRTDQENADYIRQHFGELRSGKARPRGYHAGAYERGKERGTDISLSPLKGLRPRGERSLPFES